MLADTIVRRWQDHQPLNRLEDIHAREVLPLAKSTICTRHDQLAELARPLVEAILADAYREPYLRVDATGVLVLAKEKCRNGHFWVLVAPEKHILYRFSKAHNSAAVDKLLQGYTGYLVADAHAVYDHLFKGGDVIEVGCMAHCRRYFFKALTSDPERAKLALSHLTALFRIERTIADAPRKRRSRFGGTSPGRSSNGSSNRAKPRRHTFSTNLRSPLASGTRSFSGSRCGASSTTVACQ
jgi:hypothetical protein